MKRQQRGGRGQWMDAPLGWVGSSPGRPALQGQGRQANGGEGGEKVKGAWREHDCGRSRSNGRALRRWAKMSREQGWWWNKARRG
jgi:hypothetical protein